MPVALAAQIQTPAGVRRGAGPLTRLTRWTHTARLDQSGSWSADASATDVTVQQAQLKDRLLARARVGGRWQAVGGGVYDSDQIHATGAAPGVRTLGGNDLLDELGTRTMRGLLLRGSDGSPVVNGHAAIMAYAPPGWDLVGPVQTLTPVYYQFAQETVLEAWTKLVQLGGGHFRLAQGTVNPRTIEYVTGQPASGIQAFGQVDPVAIARNGQACVITDLTITGDSHDVVTAVTPTGAGSGDAALTLLGTTRTAPAGFSLDPGGNWLSLSNSPYGTIERAQQFPDVGVLPGGVPLDGTSAANALFDAALLWLRQHSVPHLTYRLQVVGCPVVLQPGTTLRVVWHGLVHQIDPVIGQPVAVRWLNVNADLVILEATLAMDGTGVITTSLQVSTLDRWPATDATILAGTVQRVAALTGHAQPGATLNALRVTPVAGTLGTLAYRAPVYHPITGQRTGYMAVYNTIT